MLIKTKNLRSKYDYIIVGSGIIGMTILRELIEREKTNILVIESGSIQSKSPYPFFMNVKSKNIKTKSRFSGVGGSSNVWGSISGVFDEEQINFFYKKKQFPINFATYKKYIDKASKYGFPELKNFSVNNFTNKNLKVKKFIKISPNIRYFHFSSILEGNKVHFLQNSIVDRVDDNKVFFQSESQRKNSVITNKVILCANTIENIKILSRSKLNIDTDILGKGFMNHPKGVIGSIKKKEMFNYFIPYQNKNEIIYHGIQLKNSKYKHYLKINTGFRIPILDRYIKILDGNLKFYKKVFVGTSDRFINYYKLYLLKVLKFCRKLLNVFFKNYFHLEAFTEMKMTEHNEVKYNKENNITEVNYKLSSDELISLNLLIAEFEKTFKTNIIFKPSNLEKLNKIVSNDASHHMGGIICGENQKNSVVDLNLRLHNSKSIYVCSGGIFPFSGVANPTLSYVALAIWLAEEI